MNFDQPLSPHFLLRELLLAEHRSIDNTPPAEVVECLAVLCQTLLEPVRHQFGPLRVISGYRCLALNRAIGSKDESAHIYGCAVDFQPFKERVTVTDIARWVKDRSRLLFDQVLDEGTPTATWVHLATTRPGFPGPRQQALVMRNGSFSALA